MPRPFRTLLPLLCLLVSSRAPGADWSAYTSDNFTLYSDTDESDALEVLENFELFRSAALTLLNLPDVAENQRLVIMVFDRGRDFNSIKPSGDVVGFFYHSVFGPRMMIGPGRGAEGAQAVLFHEYVHYLMDQHSMFNFPRWYSEGLATLLSSADITDSSIVIGNAPPGYLRAIALDLHTTVENVIDTKPDGAAGDFYLTSWLLTHYLLLDEENAPARRASMLEYLSRVDAGQDPVDAFTASFGIFPGQMQTEIDAYGRRRVLTAITMPRSTYSGELSRRAMTEGEASYRLGDIAVERDSFAAAYGYFDRFEEVAPDSPFRLNVDSRRAIALVHEERIDEGDALMDRLLATDVDDPDVLADMAHYAYDRFVYELEESGEQAGIQLDRSIDYGARAVEANAGDVEALYYLGLAYEARGELQPAADALFRSYDINPSVQRLNMALVRVMIKGRQPEVAAYLVSRMYSASHSEEARARLLELRDDIEAGTVDLEEIGGLPAATDKQ